MNMLGQTVWPRYFPGPVKYKRLDQIVPGRSSHMHGKKKQPQYAFPFSVYARKRQDIYIQDMQYVQTIDNFL